MSDAAFGPQYAGDDPVTCRLRFHQSWWRVDRLGAPAGVDARGTTYGNYLTEADASAGLNFLTPDIHRCALDRIDSGGGVEKFRCTRNLLSSQPMAFNLFGPLHDDPDLAALLLNPLLPGGVATATVDIEWAPSKKLHLRDATSFDVVARYVRADGRNAIAGIETKLTEPFSQRTYGRDDHRTDRYREVARRSDVIPTTPTSRTSAGTKSGGTNSSWSRSANANRIYWDARSSYIIPSISDAPTTWTPTPTS